MEPEANAAEPKPVDSPTPQKGFWAQLPESLQLWPNRITLLRVLAVPVLFWLAIEEYRLAFTIVFGILGLTDWLDGIVARWRKEESAFGARFDSAADLLFGFSTLLWVFILEPDSIAQHWLLITAAAILVIGAEIFAYVRYGHLIDFHTYLSKTAAVSIYAFMLYTVLRGFSTLFFSAVIAVILLATLENILLTALYRKVQQNARSILFILFGRKGK